MKRQCIFIFTAMMVFAMTGALYAGQVGTTLTVQLSIEPACSVSADPMDFGSGSGEEETTDTAIRVTCPEGMGFQIALDKGLNGTSSQRKMSDGSGNTIDYELYQNQTHTVIHGDAGLGNTYPSGNPSSHTAWSGETAVAVYGKTTANLSAAAGAYEDVVTVTVYY